MIYPSIAILSQVDLINLFLENPLYQRALIGGLAIALLCGVLSVFVVLKRMSFIGQGISHAAFGGVGVALMAQLLLVSQWPVLAGEHADLIRDGIIALFCIATAITIGFISRRGKLAEDTVIGISLVAAMALGVILLDIYGRHGPAPSFESILFGSIFFIGPMDVWVAWTLAAVVVSLVTMLFKELTFFAFDEETAEVFGVRTGLIYYGLLVALGLCIVVAMKGLGVILSSALLVLPGAIARFWSKRIEHVVVISAVVSMIGLSAGLALAIWLDASPGSVIVLTFTAIFAVSYFFRNLCRRKR